VLREAPSGWRNARLPDQQTGFVCGGRELQVSYGSLRDGSFRLGDGGVARIHGWSGDAIDVEIDGRRWRSRITCARERLVVQTPRGDVELAIQPRFVVPGSEGPSGGLKAPMPGKVIELRVRAGQSVRAGETLLVLEAMKMEHPMRAPEDGVVAELRVAVGDQVENGALLLVVEPAAAGGSNEETGDS
jgi:propionyl-CoA carboxylase alpha chain